MKVKRSLFLFQRLKKCLSKWRFILANRGQVQLSVTLEHPENIRLGEGAKLGEFVKLYATKGSRIELGARSVIGTDSLVYAFSKGKKSESVLIGRDCIIGAKSVVLQGARVGDGSVVGAGSVVLEGTRIPSGELWAGVPAVFKKKVN